MTKKVSGYLDSMGKFHETKAEADFADARGRLKEILRVNDMSQSFFFDFILKYETEIKSYLQTRRAMHLKAKADDETERDNKAS